jgi:hypothetical protein
MVDQSIPDLAQGRGPHPALAIRVAASLDSLVADADRSASGIVERNRTVPCGSIDFRGGSTIAVRSAAPRSFKAITSAS